MFQIARERLKITVQGALLAGILALLIVLMVPGVGVGPALAEEPAAEAMTPEDYLAIQDLRQRLALTNEDLASMGCTQQQAEAVLITLKGWHATNKQALVDAQVAEHAAEQELADAMQRFHTGPRDEAVNARIPGVRRAAAAAVAARKVAIEQVIPTIAPQLSGEQADLWVLGRANLERPSQLRYVANLTDDQVKRFNYAMSKRTAGGPSQVDIEQRVLSASQTQARSAAHDRTRQHMEAVLAADEAVLPMPEELRPEPYPISESEAPAP